MLDNDGDDEIVLLDEPVVDTSELVEVEADDDDYEPPTEEIILLDVMRIDDAELDIG